jgi:tRNA threonylcarbamoyladenosine modification (KEOPS) complex  Pcc1 subunit
MEAVVELRVDLPEDIFESISTSMSIESMSSPPDGTVEVERTYKNENPFLVMRSCDLSTSRAMLNSYLGLLSVALRAAGEG